MPPRRLTIPELADALAPGELVYLPGSAGEPTPLLDHWREDPGRMRGLRLLSTFVPGINAFASEDLPSGAAMTGLFMQPALRAAQQDGRYRHLPLSYSGFVRHLRDRTAIDTCIVHVAPPDAHGRCSLGPAVEFTVLAQAASRRTIALVNPRLPRMPGAVSLDHDAFDAVVEVAFDPKGYRVGAPNPVALAIAGHIAGFIEDGCTLQVGLGKVPDALMSRLRDRRGLRLHSGMLADSALPLWDGALDLSARHASCVWVGSAALYERLDGWGGPLVLGCDVTHDIATLAGLPRFRTVNSALGVDLFGQANLEIAGGQAVSGLGGAADFARGARLAPGGLSIVALPAATPPSRTGRGARSRIVPRLDDALASLSRHDVDVVVTEQGAADLRGLSVHERAETLIAIADPAFHGALCDAWHDIRAAL